MLSNHVDLHVYLLVYILLFTVIFGLILQDYELMNCVFQISTTYPLENDLVHKIYSTIVRS
jgi:hypothetical protein